MSPSTYTYSTCPYLSLSLPLNIWQNLSKFCLHHCQYLCQNLGVFVRICQNLTESAKILQNMSKSNNLSGSICSSLSQCLCVPVTTSPCQKCLCICQYLSISISTCQNLSAPLSTSVSLCLFMTAPVYTCLYPDLSLCQPLCSYPYTSPWACLACLYPLISVPMYFCLCRGLSLFISH